MGETRRWVSVTQAALALGISTNSVRRRMKDGTLVFEEKERKQGKVYEVLLPDGLPLAGPRLPATEETDQGVSSAVLPPPGETSQGVSLALVELVTRLESARDREVVLSQRIGELTGAIDRLSADLMAAHDDRIEISSQLVRETVRRAEAEGRALELEKQLDRTVGRRWHSWVGRWLGSTPQPAP